MILVKRSHQSGAHALSQTGGVLYCVMVIRVKMGFLLHFVRFIVVLDGVIVVLCKNSVFIPLMWYIIVYEIMMKLMWYKLGKHLLSLIIFSLMNMHLLI